MARNLTTVSSVVNDFLLSIEHDDYVNNASDTIVDNYAKRGIRELGFDVMRRVKSVKLSVNAANNTVDLPDDFVDILKLGVVGADGLVRVFAENKHINFSQIYSETAGGEFIDSNGDGIYDRVDSKTGISSQGLFGDDAIVFSNYIYQNSVGQLYGLGGGFAQGEYRLNLDQNRIDLATNSSIGQVVIEYVADEARAVTPTVHLMAEEALVCYIYWRLVRRKSSVPANEKARARAEWYNEKRKAKGRLNGFSMEEAIRVSRKNFKLSPKY